MRYRGRHRRVAPQRRTRRLATLAALTATTLLAPLALTGPAATYAGSGVPSVTIETERIPETVTFVTNAINNCLAPDGLCAKAATIANTSISLALVCTDKALSDAGFPVLNVNPPTSGLSCDDAAAAALDLAMTVAQEVGACDGTTAATCVVVLDAVALAVDRAAGCTAGALNAAGVETTLAGGTDIGCGNAVYAVQAVADGLADMLAGCLAGASGGTGADTDTCRLVVETATFVVNNLEGCVGALWVAADEIPVPLPFGGTLNCFGVVDQANQSLDNLLQRTPDVPWTISPTPDCSATVGWPSIPASTVSDSSNRRICPRWFRRAMHRTASRTVSTHRRCR